MSGKQADVRRRPSRRGPKDDDGEPEVAVAEPKKKRFFLDHQDDMTEEQMGLIKGLGASEYWCGTFDDSPVQNVSLAGVSFSRQSERTIDQEGSMKTKRIPRRGQRNFLTEDQYAAVLKAADSRVVRWTGRDEKNRIGRVIIKDARYKPQNNDVPFNQYVYCVPVDEAARRLGPSWLEGEPWSLAES